MVRKECRTNKGLRNHHQHSSRPHPLKSAYLNNKASHLLLHYPTQPVSSHRQIDILIIKKTFELIAVQKQHHTTIACLLITSHNINYLRLCSAHLHQLLSRCCWKIRTEIKSVVYSLMLSGQLQYDVNIQHQVWAYIRRWHRLNNKPKQ